MCLARRPRAQPGARLSHRAVHSATGSNGGAKYWGSFEEELGEWKGFEEKREHLPHARMFLRHSPEHIVGHAARRRIAPDTFPLLECADLPGSGIRRTPCARHVGTLRGHGPPSLAPFSRIARAQKSGFTIPDAPLRRSDRMPSSGSVRQTSGQPGHKGGRTFSLPT